MAPGTSHTTKETQKVGKCQVTPVTLPDGSVEYLLIDPQGRLLTNPNRDFELEVAIGNVSGFKTGDKFGENADVDIGTEDVVSQGGIVNILSSGSQLAIKSSDADDTSGGAGARQVKLYYLDSSYVEQTETLTLNGVTLVNTVATNILRPYRMIVIAAGSSNENEGTLTLENTGGGTVYLQIDATANQTLSTFYTVPAGKTLFILDWDVTVGEANRATKVRLLATADGEGNNIPGIFTVKRTIKLEQDHYTHVFTSPLRFNEKVDIKVCATADQNNTLVTSSYCFILVDD